MTLPSSPPPPSPPATENKMPTNHRSVAFAHLEKEESERRKKALDEYISTPATPSSPETPELRTLIDELLETRRRIASGECASFDEAAYLAEVEDDLRAKISAFYNRQREEIERLETRDAQSERIIRRLESNLRLQSGGTTDV